MQVDGPDSTASEPAIAVATKAVQQHCIHSTSAVAIPRLRYAISAHCRTRHGLDLAASRIVVTAGVNGALLVATGVRINPGDEILMPDPADPHICHFVRIVEGG
jgi:aspartate/methionine/tyrosine aminotransferase